MKLIIVSYFIYNGIFRCFPEIVNLNFDVKTRIDSFNKKNESFADKYNYISKSAKNKRNKY